MKLGIILANGLNNFCSETNILKALKIVSTLVMIIKIVAPVVLVITGIVALAKVVINGDETKDAVRSLITKFVIAVFIFLIPSIVYAIMGLVDQYNRNAGKYTNCINCLKSPNNCG